jgi:hypothetical protein
MNIQDEVAKIHHQFGTSEMANYKIQLLFESYLESKLPTKNKIEEDSKIYFGDEHPNTIIWRGGYIIGAKAIIDELKEGNDG